MDAVQRLLLLVAQRRGVLHVDLGFATDVAMTFEIASSQEARHETRLTVCEADIEAAADKLASEITGHPGASGRRP